MFKNKFGLLAIVFLVMLGIILAACGDDAEEGTQDPAQEESEGGTEGEAENAEPVAGGTITGAMYSAPAGMFNPIFYEESYEANILSFTHESLVSQNESLEFIPGLATDWETNEDQTELTLYLEEGVKWHDGEDFTADDVVFTYKAMSDPDYVTAGGIRTAYVTPLLGYEQYVAGETDEFQGVVAVDDYTVTFKFAEPNINPLYYASFPIIPEHVFADIPVAEMPEASESRDAGAVIGTGPFKFTEMVEREQYVLERNEDYWQGAPYLESIVWRVVAQSVMTGLLESGEVDFIADPNGIPPADYETVQALGNIEIIEQPDFGYQILGFKVNHRTAEDVESGAITPENWVPNEKIADPRIRQAMAYAINREGLIEGLLYGRGAILNSPIAKQFWAYDESETTNYTYDPDMAASILDELGYVDTNDDGFREDPDGNEWVINFDYPTGNELREKSAPLIEQMLEEVGINVNLRQPKEMSAYVEDLTNDNSDWDLYLLGWSLGSADPDPTGLWGTTAAYNFSRWNNPDSEALMQQALQAPEAFDQEYRTEVYKEWQKLFSEDLPALLLYAQNSLWAYNERLQGVEALPFTMYNDPHLWWVTDAE
ncbi:peptide-binding protein [Ornithinibacillus contaminans]|uniref:peptide-binding protein n=1 Tax=Ornithinibacillus contaminans TaxID=694055 RepID=UPI00064DDB7F|nr:peptide-binding protein [Ornithinibacillus contaminans]